MLKLMISIHSLYCKSFWYLSPQFVFLLCLFSFRSSFLLRDNLRFPFRKLSRVMIFAFSLQSVYPNIYSYSNHCTFSLKMFVIMLITLLTISLIFHSVVNRQANPELTIVFHQPNLTYLWCLVLRLILNSYIKIKYQIKIISKKYSNLK